PSSPSPPLKPKVIVPIDAKLGRRRSDPAEPAAALSPFSVAEEWGFNSSASESCSARHLCSLPIFFRSSTLLRLDAVLCPSQ
ncbi:hypothetical protein PIB30_107533, partial [Stylosanthes scabra]|nr:hypothetical protein [Stylosanthes scabra]